MHNRTGKHTQDGHLHTTDCWATWRSNVDAMLAHVTLPVPPHCSQRKGGGLTSRTRSTQAASLLAAFPTQRTAPIPEVNSTATAKATTTPSRHLPVMVLAATVNLSVAILILAWRTGGGGPGGGGLAMADWQLQNGCCRGELAVMAWRAVARDLRFPLQMCVSGAAQAKMRPRGVLGCSGGRFFLGVGVGVWVACFYLHY